MKFESRQDQEPEQFGGRRCPKATEIQLPVSIWQISRSGLGAFFFFLLIIISLFLNYFFFFFTKIKLKPQRPPRFSSTFTKGVTAPGFSTSSRFNFPYFSFPPPILFRLFIFPPKFFVTFLLAPPAERIPHPTPLAHPTPGETARVAAVLTSGPVTCAPLRAPPLSGGRAQTGRRSGTEVTTGWE